MSERHLNFRSELAEWWSFARFGVAAMLVFTGLVYSLGLLADFYHGEDFLLFRYAETEGFFSAIRSFFSEYGRLFEAIYWVTLYKLTGYQPAWQHMMSLFLNILAASVGSFAIFRIFANGSRSKDILLAIFLFLFFNPFTLNWSLIISGDNSRISLILFFLSLVFFQNWSMYGFKSIWAILGFLSFLLASLTYENVVLMFPAIVLLIFSMRKKEIMASRRSRSVLGLLTAASFMVPFIPILAYSFYGVTEHPVARGDGFLATLPWRVSEGVFQSFEYLTKAGEALASLKNLSFIPLILILFLLVLAGYAVFSDRATRRSRHSNPGLLFIFLSAVWLILISVLTYGLAYPNSQVYVRFFVVSMFGIALLFGLAGSSLRFRGIVLLSLALTIGTGLLEFQQRAKEINAAEFSQEFDYLSLLEVAPEIKGNSSFILVDGFLGTNALRSCSYALQMLYDKSDIRCLYVSHLEPAERAVWDGEALVAEGGVARNGNYIILGIDGTNRRYVIPSLSPGDPVLVEWLQTNPIQTDFRRFIDSNAPLETGMIRKLLERQAASKQQ
jgi:hypothetical protein